MRSRCSRTGPLGGAVNPVRPRAATNPAAPQPFARVSRPTAKPRSSRAMPLRSAAAVATMSTRLSGSSTQSTGTSWMRRPARSASTSSSVSKNQPVSDDVRQQALRDVGADRLEAALRVGEARRERGLEDQVVAARDDLALRPAHHARSPAQPRPDRQVGVTGDQRRDERGECGEIGRQVDVHVCQHRSIRCRPHRVQRAAAALLLEPHHPDAVELDGKLRGNPRRVVDAGVVGDRDARRKRELVSKMAVQAMHRIRQRGLLVVDRDHHVEHGNLLLAGRQRRVRSRFKADVPSRAGITFEDDVCHEFHGRAAACVGRWAKLCPSYVFFGGWVRS